MTDAIVALAAPSRPLALSEHRDLRFFLLFLLYSAQGMPAGLFRIAIASWLAQNGASAAEIGALLALSMLPWSLKAINCFLVDRYAFLAMGRRRPWIIGSQFAIVAVLVIMAIANPAASEISIISAFAFTMSIGTSMQDVAVDGLAVDIVPSDEAARASGFCWGGQVLGLALGAGLGGYLIAYHGLQIALLAMAAVVAVILGVVIIVRERPGERLLPWTKGAATQRNLDLHVGEFWPIIRDVLTAMFQRSTFLYVCALFCAGAVSGLFVGLGPIYSVEILGWEKDTYSGWVSQSNLAAGILGMLLFGAIADRWGARRMLILVQLGTAAAALIMMALQPYWATGLILICFIFALKSLITFGSVAAGAVSMGLCVPAVAASQFAMLNSVGNFGQMTAAASLGWLDSLGGIPAMFTAMAVCGLVGGAFAFAAKVGR